MNYQSLFAVRRFENRNGAFSFWVDGYLKGARIRRTAAQRFAKEMGAASVGDPLMALSGKLDPAIIYSPVGDLVPTRQGRPS